MIDKSSYKTGFIAKKIGMPAVLFYIKKHRGCWAKIEVERILAVIENEEKEDHELGQIMRTLEKESNYMSYDDLKIEMGWNLEL